MADFIVAVSGLAEAANFDEAKRGLKLAALRALNRVADRTRTRSADAIRAQVNFPPSYLNPKGGRLVVTQRATSTKLEARIRGRDRPTSLARFASGSTRGPVRLEVKPGLSKFVRRAFLIKLRSGNSDINTRSNLGLAIRLKDGETLQNKRTQVKIARGLYLLYGPSVNQVFEAVAKAEAEGREIGDEFEREFFRLLELE